MSKHTIVITFGMICFSVLIAASGSNHQPLDDRITTAFGAALNRDDHSAGFSRQVFVDKANLSGIDLSGDLVNTARSWVAAYPRIYGLTADELVPVVNQTARNLNYVIFRQKYQEVPVYQSRIDFRFRSARQLIYTATRVFPAIDLNPAPAVDPAEALILAQAETDFTPDSEDFIADRPQLFVYVETDEELHYRLGWRLGLFVHHEDPTQFERSVSNYEVWVDAHSGEVFSIFDRVEELPISGYVTGLVKDVPYGTPTSRPLRNLEVAVAGIGSAYTDENGYYEIEAGAVDRQVTINFSGEFIDIDARNTTPAEIITTVTPGDTHDVFFMDLNSIAGERDTYYHGNRVHDWMLALDNAFPGADYSMPAAVNIGSEDNLWPCNAYWDGYGINMFSAGGGCSATDQMADVIYHEYQHGLTQFAYSPFSSPYASGMGEGFSDYTAMTILNTPCMGDAFFGTPGECLRHGENNRQWPAPECNGSVHCLGEITMGSLWLMRENLIAAFGDYDAAVAHSDTLFRWSMFGRPTTVPDLLTEILMVDDTDGTLLNGTPNFVAIIQAFDDHSVESPIPDFGIVHTPLTNTVDTSSPMEVAAVISSIQGDITTAELIYTVGDVTNTVQLTDLGNSHYSGEIPPQPSGSIIEYYLHAVDAGGLEIFSPGSAPQITYFYLVGELVTFQEVFADKAETDAGWQLGVTGDAASSGIWERVDPIGTSSSGLPTQPEDDHTTGGVTCFVTGNAPFDGSNAGDNDVDGGQTTLLSPAIDLSGYINPIVTYWRWYSNNTGDAPGLDDWLVQVSADNSNWQTLELTSESAAEWSYHQFLVKQYLDSPQQLYLRFIAEDDGDGSLVEAAVDDILIINGISIDYDYGDINFDAEFNVFDILLLVDIILSRIEPTAVQRHVSDVNRDGTINVLDVISLVNIVISAER